MSWIQKNKFTAALAGVTAVGSIALISLSMGKSDATASAQSKLKKSLRSEAKIKSLQPFPSQNNLEEKQSIVNDYAKGAQDLQGQFAAYRPKANAVADFAPDKFSAIVSSYRNRLNYEFQENKVELPDQCVYGFEAYANKFPRPEATGELSYQVKATEWLLTKLAKNKPEALLNVVRAKFDLESAPAPVTRGSRNTVKAAVKEPAYYVMPLELTFRSDEKGLSNFLSEIANTDRYAFVIRNVRVQNERMTPPTKGDAQFEPAKVKTSMDYAFVYDDDSGVIGGADTPIVENAVSAAEEADVPTVGSDSDQKRLLLPVLGSEKVNVFLKLDLILLNQSAELTLDEDDVKVELKKSSSAN